MVTATSLWDRRNKGAPRQLLEPTRISDAQDYIIRTYSSALEIEKVSLESAVNRVLARDLAANVDLPRFDASAVDGYAVRAASLSATAPGRFKVVGRSAAGHPYAARVGPDEAVRILTGAALPAGTDHIFMQEDCLVESSELITPVFAKGRSNIRRRGEDIQRKEIALGAGERIATKHLTLAAALGEIALPVFRRLRVALFSTGDEVHTGDPGLGHGEIVDANRPMLRGLLTSLGCWVDDRGVMRDDPEAQISALIGAARDCDLIVTTGGMSVGDEDHLSRVITRRGRLEIWRLKIKPGKPVGLGDIDDCPILALPGNPLAALVTFIMLGTPLIARLSGCSSLLPRRLRLPLGQAISKRRGRWEALPAQLVTDDQDVTSVVPMGKTGSAMLTSLAGADGFIALPEDADELPAGAVVDFLILPRD